MSCTLVLIMKNAPYNLFNTEHDKYYYGNTTSTAVSIASPGYAITTNESTIETAPMPIRSARIHAGDLTERSVFFSMRAY
jgi:hypothetical protein